MLILLLETWKYSQIILGIKKKNHYCQTGLYFCLHIGGSFWNIIYTGRINIRSRVLSHHLYVILPPGCIQIPDNITLKDALSAVTAHRFSVHVGMVQVPKRLITGYLKPQQEMRVQRGVAWMLGKWRKRDNSHAEWYRWQIHGMA